MLLSAGASDGAIKFWDIRSFKAPLMAMCPSSTSDSPTSMPAPSQPCLTGAPSRVRGITSLSQDAFGSRLTASCTNGRVYVVDMGAPLPRVSHTLQGAQIDSFFVKAGISSDGTRVACGGSDGSINVWQLSSNDTMPSVTFQAHQGEVTALRWSPVDGSSLLSAADDSTVALHTLHPLPPPSPPRCHPFSASHTLSGRASAAWRPRLPVSAGSHVREAEAAPAATPPTAITAHPVTPAAAAAAAAASAELPVSPAAAESSVDVPAASDGRPAESRAAPAAAAAAAAAEVAAAVASGIRKRPREDHCTATAAAGNCNACNGEAAATVPPGEAVAEAAAALAEGAEAPGAAKAPFRATVKPNQTAVTMSEAQEAPPPAGSSADMEAGQADMAMQDSAGRADMDVGASCPSDQDTQPPEGGLPAKSVAGCKWGLAPCTVPGGKSNKAMASTCQNRQLTPMQCSG
ncbi:hypothetical protein CLOP_g955 [Closterium sp. NIES-67]|nr:hypothetical protein CLOP_g955 [Closterium sp. NIES-67]